MSLTRRILNLGRSDRLSRDIERELAFHIREHAEELMAQGMAEADAMAAARRRFGNATTMGERTRDADVVGWLDSLLGDVRYGVRALRQSPLFALVAVLSLALAIGANTAIYTLMDVLLIRPLPVPAAEQLVQVVATDDDDEGVFTNPLWEQIRDRQHALDAIAAFSTTSFDISNGGETRRISGVWASGAFFELFGMQPAVGRLFTRGDDVRGCPGIAVLGHGFWQREYGGSADAVGRMISITGKPLQIVGVTRPGFSSPEVGRDVDLYAPICAEAYVRERGSSLDARSNWWLRVIGRRAPDASLPQVIAQLKSIAAATYAATVPPRWGADDKQDYLGRTLSAIPAESGMSYMRTRYGTALKVLMGAVALVLLIACVNVANLLLARAAAREREMAIRLAIGAARRRLVRQLLTESIILAFLGAAAGLFVAAAGTRALVAMISTPDSPVALDLAVNGRVLAFTMAVATLTALIFGLVPAWRATRVSPQSAMKAGGRGIATGAGRGRFALSRGLVMLQVGLSLTLLAGAGLLIGSLRNLRDMDPGFRPEGVLVASMGFGRSGIPQEQLADVQRQVLARVRAIAGVRFASTADLTPVSGNMWNDVVYPDIDRGTPDRDRLMWFNEIGDDYFATMDTRLIAGRHFDDTESPRSPPAAVLNEEAARRLFGDVPPIGHTFRLKTGDTFSDPYVIVGIVETSKYGSLRETTSGTIYLSARQLESAPSGINVVARTDGDPLQLVPAIKQIAADVHPLTSVEFHTLSDQVDASLRREQMLAWLSGVFGGVALALSVLGLYGVMAYSVARRRNEIGVRIALGADRGRVLRLVLGDIARVLLVGVALGVAGAFASGKLVASFLFGLEPADPLVLAAAAALLCAIALLAGLIPARRATRVDPVAALRED